ncbi:major facilitator superfamily transporter [Fusarium oxysporum f. sp. phaseoli]
METHTHFTVSVIAGDTFARSLDSVAGPLFTDSVFEIIEIGWGNTLIGRVATILSFLPFGFRRYGQQIQKPSKYVVMEPGKGCLKPEISSTGASAMPEVYGILIG